MLVEITTSVAVALSTALLAMRSPAIGWVLLWALLIRFAAVLYHTFVNPLPESGADALYFQQLAEAWSQQGWQNIFQHFPGATGYIYSWFLAFLYAIDGPSPYSAQIINVGLGVVAVYLTYVLGRELWQAVAARRAAWLVALFPTAILYSSVTLRESIIVVCFLAGVLCAVRWQKGQCASQGVLAVFYFLLAGWFHGAMLLAIGGMALGGLCIGVNLRNGLTRQALSRSLAAFMLIIVTVALAFSDIELPKIGTFREAASADDLASRADISARGGAAYPGWLLPSSGTSSVALLPPRIAYLLCAPFPWDVRGAHQLVGLVDGACYGVLLVLIWRSRRQIAACPGAQMALVLAAVMVVVFAMGVSNFGTGLRHRAKFFAVLAVLAAPALPRFYTGKE